MIKDLKFTQWLALAFERVGNVDWIYYRHKRVQITRPLSTMSVWEEDVVEDSEPEREECRQRRQQEETSGGCTRTRSTVGCELGTSVGVLPAAVKDTTAGMLCVLLVQCNALLSILL